MNFVMVILVFAAGLAGVVVFISSFVMKQPPSSAPPPTKSSAWSLAVFGLAVCSNIAALGLGVSSVPMFKREVEFGGYVLPPRRVCVGVIDTTPGLDSQLVLF